MTTAPIAANALELVLRPFGRGTMLPAEAYISTEVFAWEGRHLLAGSWWCLGREADLRVDAAGRPVTQRACTVGGVPVLLTWPPGGGLKALANTCRHRGHELVPDGEVSDRSSLLCPYHAWRYRLDGGLARAPGFQDVDAFAPHEHGLVELPLAVWHGWVFVNAAGGAAPFTEHLGALADLVRPYAAEELVVLGRHDYQIAANWKVVVENYHECYHCPLIHPELCRVSPPTSGRNFDLPGAWVGGAMDLRDGAVTMSLDGRSSGILIDGADPRVVVYVGLFPNLLLSLHPDYVMTHRLIPLGPCATAIECSWHFVDGVTDPSFAIDFWDRTNRQDWAACESVQRGLSSPHYRPGPLAPNEDAVYSWITMIARAYLGVPPHIRG